MYRVTPSNPVSVLTLKSRVPRLLILLSRIRLTSSAVALETPGSNDVMVPPRFLEDGRQFILGIQLTYLDFVIIEDLYICSCQVL